MGLRGMGQADHKMLWMLSKSIPAGRTAEIVDLAQEDETSRRMALGRVYSAHRAGGDIAG